MKAQVLRGPSDLALGEIATPTSAGGQVVVRITHSGICGTDWKIFNGSIPVKYPRVMGHEMAGEVVDAGASTQVRVGDRVIIDPETYCGQCFHCNIGQTHLCPNGTLIGRDQKIGPGRRERIAPGGELHVPAETKIRRQLPPGRAQAHTFYDGLKSQRLGQAHALAFHSGLAVGHHPARRRGRVCRLRSQTCDPG